MAMKFDTSKKSQKELVLKKHVTLNIHGKNYMYFMTNDFTVISEKLKSFGFRIPAPEDFMENPALAENVRQKMKELGATWSLTITSRLSVLNYYNPKDKNPFIVFLEELMPGTKNSCATGDEIPQKHQSFSERFYWYLQKYWERFPSSKHSDIYKAAGLSKQTFSKIFSNRKADFRPKKDTAIQLSLGLKLTLNETEDFLQSAGYVFSDEDKKDIEIKHLLSERNYKIFDWNKRIYKVTGKVYFKALVESEEE